MTASKLYCYITVIVILIFVPSFGHAHPASIPLEMLELKQVKYTPIGNIELPKNWRYQVPLAYDDGTNLNLEGYTVQNGGFMAYFMTELRDSYGEEIAYMSFDSRDIVFYGLEINWKYPDRAVTQYEAKRHRTIWKNEMLRYMKNSNICPETEDFAYEQWSNGLMYMVYSHCSVQDDNEKWRKYIINLYNGGYSEEIIAGYRLDHEEILEPLLQRIISSIKLGPYPPKIIEGTLSTDHKSATLRFANEEEEFVSITLPANWSFPEGNPIALTQDDNESASVKVAEDKAGASQPPRTLAEFLPTGQGGIDMGKADYNLYSQLLAEDGAILGEANLAFADVFYMYSDEDGPAYTEADLNSSAPAREKFDRGRAEGLEGCALSNWQEHGHLPFAEALLHDSYLKTCEEGVFEVHSVKFYGKGRAPTFVFTGLFPTDKAQEMRPIMEEIMNSIRPEY